MAVWMAQHPRLGRASPLYTIDGNRERKSSILVVVRSMYTRALTLSPLYTLTLSPLSTLTLSPVYTIHGKVSGKSPRYDLREERENSSVYDFLAALHRRWREREFFKKVVFIACIIIVVLLL